MPAGVLGASHCAVAVNISFGNRSSQCVVPIERISIGFEHAIVLVCTAGPRSGGAVESFCIPTAVRKKFFLQGGNVCQGNLRIRTPGLGRVSGVTRIGDGGEYAHDHHDDHQLDQGKTGYSLLFHANVLPADRSLKKPPPPNGGGGTSLHIHLRLFAVPVGPLPAVVTARLDLLRSTACAHVT